MSERRFVILELKPDDFWKGEITESELKRRLGKAWMRLQTNGDLDKAIDILIHGEGK